MRCATLRRHVLFVASLDLLTISPTGYASAGANVWTSNGPEGGRIQALAVDPTASATVYAGTDGGGVFKSTDGAESWSPANVGLTHLRVRSLAVNPSTPSTLYAGTHGGGVFKSEDGGESWFAINAGLSAPYVQALAVDPLRSSALYAGTDGGGAFRLDQLPFKVYLPLVVRGH